MRAATAFAIIAAASGCLYDESVPPDAQFTCAADGDCPAGLVCSEADARCVPRGVEPPFATVQLTEVVGLGGVAEIIVVADQELASTPALTFAGGVDPGFLLASLEGAVATFTVAVSDTSPDEGFYLLDRVTVTSKAGLAREVPVGRALQVDRTPPRATLVVEPIGQRFADIAPFDAIDIVIDTDEPLAAPPVVEIDSATVSGACLGQGVSFACALVIEAGAAELTRTDLVVRARDIADNESQTRASIDVDFRAPALVGGAVSIDIRDVRGVAESAASPGSIVTVDVVADEPIPTAPVVAFLDDVTLDAAGVTLTQVNAQRWRAVASIAAVPAAPVAAGLSVALADVVGHAAVIAQPGVLPTSFARAGPCPPPADTCVDGDGDGDFARGSCGGSDCDDGDPLVHAGAFELPGDGVRNDCGPGGDTPIDNAHGAFMAEGGAGTECTIEAPCIDFADATARARERGYLFLQGPRNYLTAFAIDSPIVAVECAGGVCVRAGVGTSNFAEPLVRLNLTGAPALQLIGPLVDGVALSGSLAQDADDGPLTLSGVVIEGSFTASRRTLFVRTRVEIDLQINASSSTMIASESPEITVFASGVSFRRVRSGPIVAGIGATLDVASSLIEGRVLCDQCARLAYAHVTQRCDQRACITASSPSIIDVVNSILHQSDLGDEPTLPSAMVFSSDNTSPVARFRGNQISSNRESANIFESLGATFGFNDLALFESEPDCGGNRISEEGDIADDGNVLLGADATLTPGTPLEGVLPSSAASIDLFGNCLGDQPSAGADQSLAPGVW